MVSYVAYEEEIKRCLSTGDLSSFKSKYAYREILEHVDIDYGMKYLELIRSSYEVGDNEIQAFCSMNDKVGSPSLEDIDGIVCSPTSLRYVFHALKILQQCRDTKSTQIVEIWLWWPCVGDKCFSGKNECQNC